VSDAVLMSVGRVFQAAGPATQNVHMPSCRLVCGTTRLSRTAKCRVVHVVTEDTCIHSW